MRLFKRGPSEPETNDFWAWWPANRDRIAGAIAARAFDDRLVADISRAVATIHPAIASELGPGRASEHTADTDAMRPGIDGWAADIPDSIGDGGPARRIKVDFATNVAWSFQKALGVR